MKFRILILLLPFIVPNQTKAQNGFERWDTIHVFEGTHELQYPWVGGMNSPQFSPIDLNLDGIQDLFVFDRSMNRVMTFLNYGSPGIMDYHYARQFETDFPKLSSFALLRDYNCDGRADLFAQNGGGLSVYRNDYSLSTGNNWTLINPFLRETAGSANPNIYTGSPNLPAIDDIDGDGDLDIISLAVQGAMIEYHRNYSQESFGNCDSLNFKFEDGCWGGVLLQSLSNSASLGFSCRLAPPTNHKIFDGLHSAATMFSLDLDGDGDKELVVGDDGFPNLLMLNNGGSASSANITSTDDSFPQHNLSTIPVDLHFYPGGFFLDVDNDGIKDLIIANNSPNTSENAKGIWFYKNHGANNSPDFEYVTDSLFHNEMIDVGMGCNPTFFDQDGDGKLDLIMGNYGYHTSTGTPLSELTLYRNNGSLTAPELGLVTHDYANRSSLNLTGLYPAFGDMDGDNDMDMIIGEAEGTLSFYYNLGGAGHPANFVLLSSSYAGIDVGQSAAPQIIDLDRDGDKDIIVGRRNGKISWYKNTGSSGNPVFSSTPVSTFLGGVNVTDVVNSITGSATPFFVDVNGSYKLFVGSERGYVYYYTNIDNNLNGNFLLADSMLLDELDGGNLSVSGGDFDGDGKFDLVIGNNGGGCVIYRNISFTGMTEKPDLERNLSLVPNPADQYLNVYADLPANEPSTIEIYSIAGQLISRDHFREQALQISTADLKPGFYICRILTSNTTFAGKFVVQH